MNNEQIDEENKMAEKNLKKTLTNNSETSNSLTAGLEENLTSKKEIYISHKNKEYQKTYRKNSNWI